MEVGGLDKSTDSRAGEETLGVRRGWRWWQKTYRCRSDPEDNNDDRDGGRQIFQYYGDGGGKWRCGGDAGQQGMVKDSK